MDLTWILGVLLLPVIGYFCWHNVYDYNDLEDCVDTLNTNKATIFITKPEDVTDDLVIPSTIALKIIQGGSINVSAGKTVTINGWIEAGAYLIFEGDGDIVLGAHAAAASFPEWWTD